MNKFILYFMVIVVLCVQFNFAIENSASGSASGDTSLGTSGSGSDSAIIGEEGSNTPCSCSGDKTNSTGAADYSCGNYKCNSKVEVCQSVFGINDGCIPRDKLNVSIETKIVNSWSENNNKDNFTQYDATITNHVNRDIKQVYVYTNPSTFKLRDSSSLWNMIPDPTKDNHLILPLYQQTINANQSFTFGFIIESPASKQQEQSFNLTINQITFS